MEGSYLAGINLNEVPRTAQVDLCAVAIIQTAEAMATPEGRAAVERGRVKYIRHLKERDTCQTDKGGK